MKAWVPRRLDQASLVSSGDRVRSAGPPRPDTSSSGSSASVARLQIFPPSTYTIQEPSRERTCPEPDPRIRASFPSVPPIQMSRLTPSGSLVGLGISPARFGAPPRTNA